MFLSQCDRPSFTPIQNNRQNYISVYIIFIFWIANWRTKYSELNGSRRWRRDKKWKTVVEFTKPTLSCRKLGWSWVPATCDNCKVSEYDVANR
jgi:hypothetical protein